MGSWVISRGITSTTDAFSCNGLFLEEDSVYEARTSWRAIARDRMNASFLGDKLTSCDGRSYDHVPPSTFALTTLEESASNSNEIYKISAWMQANTPHGSPNCWTKPALNELPSLPPPKLIAWEYHRSWSSGRLSIPHNTGSLEGIEDENEDGSSLGIQVKTHYTNDEINVDFVKKRQ